MGTAALAAGTVALPYYIPASALGRGGAVAPSERILLGAIGIGGRGEGDLGWMMDQPDVQFVAVCDVRKDRRELAKRMVDQRYGSTDCTRYIDLRELLARPDLDAVLIATGDRWHAAASVLAMQAGKDVYCEKPSCLTIAQGQKVVDTARRTGRIFQTGTQRLSEANHVFAIEAARSGRLGKIHTVYADCRWRGGTRRDWLPAEPEPAREDLDWDAWLGPCPRRPYNAGYIHGGGWYNFHDFSTDFAQWGAHTIAQGLAGLELSGISRIGFEYGAPNASMTVRLAEGLKMVLVRGTPVNEPNAYWHGSCGERFDGPEGWAAAADGYSRPDVSSPSLLEDYRDVVAAYTARTQRPMSHVRDFFDGVRSRRPTVANPLIMYTSMLVALAADLCDQLQRNLTFDLHKAEFVNDPEANRLRLRALRVPWNI